MEFLRRVGIGGGAKAGAATAERKLLGIILKERVVRCRPQKPKFFGGAGEVAWLASEWIDGPPAFETVGLWGERSVRGVLVGAVPLLVTQRLTGGSRPNETEDGAGWHPFQDNNGVSGHAFMSSIPFITAAKMSDNVVGKAFWYSASLLGPLSRINDNAHYPSQVGLGWAMGFLAASAVQHNDTGKKGWAVVPEASFQSTGLAFQYRW